MPLRFTQILRGPALAAACLVVAGCGRSAPTATQPTSRQPGPVRFVVSIAPLQGLMRDLAPQSAMITTIIQPGRSEHGYEFTPADRAALGQADLIVYVGLNLEPPIETFVRGKPAHVAAISFAEAVGEDKGARPPAAPAAPDADDHDQDDGHHHGLADPHLWLDPDLVARFLPKLSAAISQAAIAAGADPAVEHERARAALDAALGRVTEIDAAYRRQLAPFAGRAIVTHHSAWARLANRYGLTVAAVIRPIESAETTPEQLQIAVNAVRERHATAIFVEPQFDPAAARRIAASAGARLGTLDPLGSGDWFALMRSNLAELVKTLPDQPR